MKQDFLGFLVLPVSPAGDGEQARIACSKLWYSWKFGCGMEQGSQFPIGSREFPALMCSWLPLASREEIPSQLTFSGLLPISGLLPFRGDTLILRQNSVVWNQIYHRVSSQNQNVTPSRSEPETTNRPEVDLKPSMGYNTIECNLNLSFSSRELNSLIWRWVVILGDP